MKRNSRKKTQILIILFWVKDVDDELCEQALCSEQDRIFSFLWLLKHISSKTKTRKHFMWKESKRTKTLKNVFNAHRNNRMRSRRLLSIVRKIYCFIVL